MPRHKKTYKPEIINREDITLLLKNAAVMCRNHLDQWAADHVPAKNRPKFKLKSTQTMREYTVAYAAELAEHVDEGFLLGEELVWSLVSAALYIHVTKTEGKKIELESLFE